MPEVAPSKRGRGKAQASLDLIAAATRILEGIQPATVRAVCYQLFVRRLIASMSKNETDKVSRQLVWAREQDIVPWSHIVDETREAERVASWTDPDAIIRAAIRGYRKNYWSDQPNVVEVWSEKGTVRGTLAPVLNDYGITFRVMHGFGSATTINAIAQETAASQKPFYILYVGDWDPSGMWMSERDIPERLARYGGSAVIKRIALAYEDVLSDSDLPSFEASSKSKDPRYRWFVDNYGRRCWELDALSPVVLRGRVDAAILELLDCDSWNHMIEVEKAETQSMSEFFDSWTISRQASKYSDGGV